MILYVWTFPKDCWSMNNVIIILILIVKLSWLRMNTWLLESKLSSDQFPVGKVIDDKANSITATIKQLFFCEILRKMHFKLLNVFHQFMNCFFFRTKIGKSHLFIGVFQIWVISYWWTFTSMIFSILNKWELKGNNKWLTSHYPHSRDSWANSTAQPCTSLLSLCLHKPPVWGQNMFDSPICASEWHKTFCHSLRAPVFLRYRPLLNKDQS